MSPVGVAAIVSRLEALVKAPWRSVACRYTARTAAGAFPAWSAGIQRLDERDRRLVVLRQHRWGWSKLPEIAASRLRGQSDPGRRPHRAQSRDCGLWSGFQDTIRVACCGDHPQGWLTW